MASETILIQYEAETKKIQSQLDDLYKKMGITQDKSKEFGKTAGESFDKAGTSVQGVIDKINKGFKEALENIGSTIAGLFAVEKILEFGKRSVEAYLEINKAEAQLLNALKGRKEVQERLITLAKQQQDATNVRHETIIQQEAFLAIEGRTEEQIKKTIKAAIQLSAVTGEDLQSAVFKLNATYEGNIGRLGRLDAGFKKLSTTQLENGAAVDLMNNKFAGFAEAAAQSESGTFTRIGNSIKDMMEGIGGGIVNLTTSFIDLGSFIVNGFQVPVHHSLMDFNKDIDKIRASLTLLNAITSPTEGTTDELIKRKADLEKKILENSASQNSFVQNILEKQRKDLEGINEELKTRKTNEDTINKNSVEYLTKQLNEKTKLRDAGGDPNDILKLNIQIKEIEDKIKIAKGEQTESQKKAAELLQKQLELQKQLQAEILKGRSEGIADPKEKLAQEETDAYEAVKIKYASLAKTKENEALIAQEMDVIRRQYADKNIKLDDETEAKKIELHKKSTDALLALNKKLFDDAKLTIDNSTNKELATNEINFAKGTISKKKYEDEKLRIQKESADLTLTAAKVTGQSEVEIQKQIGELKVQQVKLEEERKKEIRKAAITAAFDTGKELENAYFQLKQQHMAEESDALSAKNKKEQEDLTAQHTHKGVLDKSYAAQKAALDKKQAAEEKALKEKQWKENQKASETKIAIDTAVGIIKTFAEFGFTPPGVIAAAALGAAGLIQEGVVANQKMPAFAKGVINLQGAGTSTSDSILARLSVGESVTPADKTKRYLGPLQSIHKGQFHQEYTPFKYHLQEIEKVKQEFERNKNKTIAEEVQKMFKVYVDNSGMKEDMFYLNRSITRNKSVRIENVNEIIEGLKKDDRKIF